MDFTDIEYLYAIEVEGDPGFLKIGWAKDVKMRRMLLQTGNRRKLLIYKTFMFPSGTTESFERRIHQILRKVRQQSEWFEITKEDFDTMLPDALELHIKNTPGLADRLYTFGEAKAKGELFVRGVTKVFDPDELVGVKDFLAHYGRKDTMR